jgi:small nuclear ribonucleoprotein (snRNP)-like protein
MHRWLLLVGYLASPALFARDSSAVAPKWALDLYLGGGGSEKITVRTADERELIATLVGADEATDLAVLKVEGRSLPAPEAETFMNRWQRRQQGKSGEHRL